jgi:hypothetical protein
VTGSGAEPTYHGGSPDDEATGVPSGATRVDEADLAPARETDDTGDIDNRADTGPVHAPGRADWAGPTAAGPGGSAAAEPVTGGDWAGPTVDERAAAANADAAVVDTSVADTDAARTNTTQTDAHFAGAEVTDADLSAADVAGAGAAGAAVGAVGAPPEAGPPLAEVPEPAAMPTAGEQTLLGDEDRASLQGRWRDLQGGFVDEPRETVRQAGDLVGEAVRMVTVRLTRQWESIGQDHGDSATEELRQAFRRYRALFQRLLEL